MRSLAHSTIGAVDPKVDVRVESAESPALASTVRERWRVYTRWACVIGLVFFAVYPTMNGLTSLRPSVLHLYFPGELEVPFVPAFVWVYLSMYALFLVPPFVLPAECMPALGRQLVAGTLISGVMFVLLPAELGFARTVPAGSSDGIFAAMFRIDRPYNLVPSLHVVYSSAIALACADQARSVLRIALLVWMTAITASTVFVHQHHVADLAAAFVLVLFLRRRFEVVHA
jgi:hypothetical protein